MIEDRHISAINKITKILNETATKVREDREAEEYRLESCRVMEAFHLVNKACPWVSVEQCVQAIDNKKDSEGRWIMEVCTHYNGVKLCGKRRVHGTRCKQHAKSILT